MADSDEPKPFDPNAIEAAPDPKRVTAEASGDEVKSPGDLLRDEAPTIEEPAKAPKADAFGDLRSLGSDLAKAMQDEGYHPVVLFGTNNSGKTSLLMSLFATLATEPILETGLVLCNPILGTRTGVGRHLHEQAEHTFHVKTQAFLHGEKIPKTSTALPFFVPVEFRPPDGRPAVKFAFLESNGEWYRPNISDGSRLGEVEKLYPELRSEIESFISNFQNGITFIYTAPVTQGEVYSAAEPTFDATELNYASLAIRGVLQTYDRIRANARADDRHLMLITKWDAISARSPDRAEGIEEDTGAVTEFCHQKYGQALTAFQGLNLHPSQRNLNAYCAGMINERGLLRLKHDDEVRGVIASYPVKLWSYLYKNALSASGEVPVSPFREPPQPPALVRFFTRLLDGLSG